MTHISASRLVYVEACPRFVPSDAPSEAAEDGLVYHSVMEALAAMPSEKWSGYIQSLQVSPETKGLCEESALQIAGYFGMGLPIVKDAYFKLPDPSKGEQPQPCQPGIYPECTVETWPGRKGRLDLLVVPAIGYGTIIDYKSSRKAVDFELQLGGGYACALRRIFGKWTQLTGKIVAPRLEDLDEYLWDDHALDVLEARVSRIEEAAENPFTAGHCGDHCAYCKWSGHCPHQARELQQLAPVESGVATVATRVLFNPSTPEERAVRRTFVSWCGKFADAVKEDDKAYFNANPGATLPGYKVVVSKGRKSLDKTRLAEVYAKLKSTFAFDDAALLSMSVPNKDSIVDYLALVTGKTKGEAATDYALAIDEFMLEGAPVVSFRATRR